MKSKSKRDVAPERLSRRRRFLTLLTWMVGVCLSFGAYNLLVNALAHDSAGEACVPPRSLAAPAQDAVIKVDPASIAVDPGEAFSVTVKIEDVSDLGAFEFELTYDHTCVEANDVTPGPFLGSTGRSVGEVGPTFGTGIVTYGAYSYGAAPGPNGDGVLATITFQAGMNDCNSVLHLQGVLAANTAGGSISASTEDGEVRVGGTEPPSVTSITPNWGYRGQVVEDVIVQGENFQAGASVQLTKSGQSPIVASMPSVQSSTRISCTLNLGKAVIGRWTVRVTNPDEQYGERQDGFTVKAVIYLPITVKNY